MANTGIRIALSAVSRFPDLEIDLFHDAINAAFVEPGPTTAGAIAERAFMHLPTEISAFERGVVSGIIIARLRDRCGS